eukprot:4077345-Amphidinium_carterae.1
MALRESIDSKPLWLLYVCPPFGTLMQRRTPLWGVQGLSTDDQGRVSAANTVLLFLFDFLATLPESTCWVVENPHTSALWDFPP